MYLLIFTLIIATFVSAIQDADQKESTSQQWGIEPAQYQTSELRTREELGNLVDGIRREMESLRNSECMDLFSYKRVEDSYRDLNNSLSVFDISEDQSKMFQQYYGQAKEYTFRALNEKAANTCLKRQAEQELCVHFTFAKFADDVHKFARAVDKKSDEVKNFEKLSLDGKNSVKNSLGETLRFLNELESVDMSSWSSEQNFKAVKDQLTDSVFKLSEYHKKMGAQGYAF